MGLYLSSGGCRWIPGMGILRVSFLLSASHYILSGRLDTDYARGR
jgi:hypothetical protein